MSSKKSSTNLPKTPSNNDQSFHTDEKLIRIERRLDRIWGCLLQISDKIIEIKYNVKAKNEKDEINR